MKNDILDPDSSGFKNEKFFSIAILVLIIIAIGGFAILRSDAEINFDFLRGEIDPEIEEEAEEDEEGIELEEDEEETEEGETGLAQYQEGDNGDITFQEVEREDIGNSYRVEAQAGDGLTHVARRALEGHLQTRGGGQDLTPEHKVFIEDYIQKNLDHSTGWLQLGETVEVSESLIDEAIEEANNLSQDQLQNLSQYTVSS